MFHALQGMACFVTVFVSLLYGTRIAWSCGKRCDFSREPEQKKQTLTENIPAAILVYFFGFLLIFNFYLSGFVTIIVTSLTSAILLAGTIVSMTMPELKRNPRAR